MTAVTTGVTNTVTLVSLNLSRAKTLPVGDALVQSGILKAPVAHAELAAQGFVGDEQADRNHHGGPDQAVYLYRTEDYAWWSVQLGRELTLGTFGENLSVSGLPERVRIGDRLSFGEVLLEVAAPRIPCSKLAAKLNDARFVKAFTEAERPGFYARVLAPGRTQVGDKATFIANSEDAPTVLETFRWFYEKHPDQTALRRALRAPLGVRLRHHLEGKLSPC